MALAAVKGYIISQLDVKNAFLYGNLSDCEIYTKQPPGAEDGSKRVCKLLKSLYGLKQAPLVWFNLLTSTLEEMGFRPLDTDWAVLRHKKKEVYILVYVDDILLLGPNGAELKKVQQQLAKKFNLTFEPTLSKYLGINVHHEPEKGTIQLSLSRYGLFTRDRYNLNTQSKPYNVPLTLDPNAEQSDPAQLNKMELRNYQGKVGSLMWAASAVRPDIQLAASKLAQGNKEPNEAHLDQVQRALQYLYATKDLGLHYSKHAPEPLTLFGYCDANHVKNKADGKSQSGYFFSLGGSPISWASKKQVTGAYSSQEAETIALVGAVQEAIYLRRHLANLGVPQEGATKIYVDCKNLESVVTTNVWSPHCRGVHRLSWLRRQFQLGIVELVWIPDAE